MTAAKPRVFVHLRHGLDADEWRTARGTGVIHGDAPYGYQHASRLFDLAWSRSARDGRVTDLVRRAARRLLGFDLLHAWQNRQALWSADVVWTHTEHEFLADCALLAWHRRRPRLVAQSVWMWDAWDDWPAARRALFRRLLRYADVELTLSTINAEFSRVRVPGRTVISVPFGASLEWALAEQARGGRFERPAWAPQRYLLAVGGDRHRDWRTLHAAAELLPDVQVVVATVSSRYPVARPANVRVRAAGSLVELYSLYAHAAAVVLPLRPNAHASGCTVAMETQFFGRPLVTTDVGGLDAYLGERGVFLYRTGDAEDLARQVVRVLDPTRAAQGTDTDVLERRGLTDSDYAARVALVTDWLLGAAADAAPASAPRPMRSYLCDRQLSDLG